MGLWHRKLMTKSFGKEHVMSPCLPVTEETAGPEHGTSWLAGQGPGGTFQLLVLGEQSRAKPWGQLLHSQRSTCRPRGICWHPAATPSGEEPNNSGLCNSTAPVSLACCSGQVSYSSAVPAARLGKVMSREPEGTVRKVERWNASPWKS